MGMHLALLMGLALAAQPRSRQADKLHKQAQQAFDAAAYDKAADLSARELDALEPGDSLELEVRERRVLSLFLAGKTGDAKAAHVELLKRFPSFRFDADRVGPDVAAFFEPPAPPPVRTHAPATAPVMIKQPPPPSASAAPPRAWHWYYLAPLGIGQFLAQSPIRGAIILALEVGFIACNIAGYAIVQSVRVPGGVSNVARANTGQIVMNVGFFGVIGTAIAGFVDGLVFE